MPPTLAGIAYAELRHLYALRGITPSDQQWEAMAALLECLEASASAFDQLAPALYLSPIPCGVGKSQSIAAFARALAKAPDMDDIGMIVFVNRIAEARDAALELAAVRHKLCILTSDDKVNALGDHETADQAQICIATQESLRIAMRGVAGSLEHCPTFAYRWSVRQVRCWDESFSFQRGVILDNDSALKLSRAMHMIGAVDAKSALKIWSAELDCAPAGVGVTWQTLVPDLRALGVNFAKLEAILYDDQDIHLCEALALISGQKVGVTKGSFDLPTVVTHYPEIPRSLMPLVVTDASALVNRAYIQMAASGTPIVALKAAGKTYENMTVRIVDEASSRSQLKKAAQRDKLLDGVVRYVREADTDVLVFGYKGDNFCARAAVHRTLKAQLQHRLGKAQRVLDDADLLKLKPGELERIRATGRVVFYLTHGRGTATNVYRDVARVCLIGLDYPPGGFAHATSGAAQDLDLVDNHPTRTQVEEVYRGMLLDRTLQPALRGAARLSVNGDCGAMELVVFQSKRHGLTRQEYRDLFPGCRLLTDVSLVPPKETKKTHLKILQETVEARLKAGETVLSFQSLRGSGDPANFSKLTASDDWQAFLAEKGLVELALPVPRGRPQKAYVVA